MMVAVIFFGMSAWLFGVVVGIAVGTRLERAEWTMSADSPHNSHKSDGVWYRVQTVEAWEKDRRRLIEQVKSGTSTVPTEESK